MAAKDVNHAHPYSPGSFSFNVLQAMDIIIRMEQALTGEQKNGIAIGFKLHIANKTPANIIIRQANGMIEDNYILMADMLGKNLVDKIKMFEA